jgi:anti-sigma regulatory factor (Ser/Thr protein kinase)
MWQIGQLDPLLIKRSRRAFAQALRERGHMEAQVEAAVLIFGELIANACEHGRVPVDIELTSQSGQLVLQVIDSGRDIKRPPSRDPGSLRGRGFEIIERLGGRVELTRRPRSAVRVVLPICAAP